MNKYHILLNTGSWLLVKDIKSVFHGEDGVHFSSEKDDSAAFVPYSALTVYHNVDNEG